jgi:hypothetical protein
VLERFELELAGPGTRRFVGRDLVREVDAGDVPGIVECLGGITRGRQRVERALHDAQAFLRGEEGIERDTGPIAGGDDGVRHVVTRRFEVRFGGRGSQWRE